MTTLTLADSAAHEADVDALVLLARPAVVDPATGQASGRLEIFGATALPKVAQQNLDTALRLLKASGSADSVVRVPGLPKVAAGLVVVAGLGSRQGGRRGADSAPGPDTEEIRRATGAAIRNLAGCTRVAVVAPGADEATIGAVAEGAALGAYRFDHHRSDKHRDKAESAPVREVLVLRGAVKRGRLAGTTRPEAEQAALQRAAVLAGAQSWARDLVNTSPNELFPESFADAVTARAPHGVTVEVLDEAQLVEGGFGGIVGVGQGSAHPPRLVTMSYRPGAATTRLAFVGKGITFDSGGLCIKPAGSMITMKCDMGGAAAVAAAVLAIAELGLPVAVTGYLCLAENMPGSDAQRPGDVVTFRDGQTVEIINTDAEGRLVMADGIALAAESKPDLIVDVATLTGAAMVALGKRTAAVMANDDELHGDLTSAATRAGESVWPMPIAEETRAGMDSRVADFKHTGDTMGGAMVAAAFLREFVGTTAEGDPTPWGHLDIAGPAYNEGSAHGYTPKGGTGFGVRTLVQLAQDRS